MDFSGVKEILDAINASDISYFEYNTNDGHIIMDKSLVRNINKENSNNSNSEDEAQKAVEQKVTNKGEQISEPVIKENDKTEDLEGIYIVKSPMVGTFYKSASEGKEAFVKQQDVVNKGQTLCIIEAMKLMNEIESEVSGTIIEVLAKDGQMVEYGQPLFKIKES